MVNFFAMQLQAVDTVDAISPEDFKKNYYNTMKPLVIKSLSKQWPAYKKWTWDYFIDIVGDKEVGVYNNIKSDAYTPINTADAYLKFGQYLKKVKEGPLDLRIFLFNIFQHAPQIVADFTWPEELMKGFVKKYPMLFVGGQGAVTHIHFDIDMSHILHTQFIGRKKVLLFPYEEQYKLYRKPWEVLSLANFANYSQDFDYENFPAQGSYSSGTMNFGHCKDPWNDTTMASSSSPPLVTDNFRTPMETDNNLPPVPGNCVTGGRTGYSVKIISPSLVLENKSNILNKLPSSFLSF